ncbi:MAG: YciI family protein [Polaromonas sp.]
MRFLIMVKADHIDEAGSVPSQQMQQMLAEMGKFNEELVKAGVMQAAEGLRPSSKGARVHFSGPSRQVIDGPFAAETKELVAGFWLWKCASLQEAIDWAKRCPNPMPGESEIEIRQIAEADDLGEAFTPELRAQEQKQKNCSTNW